MSGWTLTQLTTGTDRGQFHGHSYYDIPVIDRAGRTVLAYRTTFVERQPTAADAVAVGVVPLDGSTGFIPLGESRAWSWQQGPMAQWIGATDEAAFNDRDGARFVCRVVGANGRAVRTLPRPVYALTPDGSTALSLNMARLDTLRPGYGYAEGEGARLDERAPAADGIWRMDVATGETRLVLSLAKARAFLLPRLSLRRRMAERLRPAHFWFNHAKVSPGGRRFTVKLRWRVLGRGWNDRQGVSLTANLDGSELRLLTNAPSHVIWLNDRQLYLWRLSELALFEDAGRPDNRMARIAPDLIRDNVHMRHLPPGAAETLGEAVFDTPYRETVDLIHYDARDGSHARIASFSGHRPERGPFRCDLHPVPSPDGRTIVVTSLRDGGRQLYALARDS